MKKSLADSVTRLSGVPSGLEAADLPAEDPCTVKAEIIYRTNLATRTLLREIALSERSSMQALMTEALTDFLIKRGRPPIP